jgi:2,3-bisphosphoglycerate-dependent phosphoglycerate mutase
LSKEGINQGRDIAEKLKSENLGLVYTSVLIRNQETVLRIFEHIPDKYPIFINLDGGRMQEWGNFTDLSNHDVTTYVTENLNERYYGELQGLNKEKTIKKYGEEKVRLWRRSYDIAPPGGETLEQVYERAVPFFREHVEKDLKAEKNVLVVASHNSLRAIVKYIEDISDEKIIDLELPFGALVKYEFNDGKYTKFA